MTPAEFQAASGCRDAALARLEIYAAQLTKWQKAINLVAPNTLPELWRRHFLDSAQVLPLAEGAGGTWLDLGSGAGFPGLVVAALGRENVILVESDTRKAVFLRETARLMDISVTVRSERIEAVPRETLGSEIGVISARALAPLEQLFAWASRFAGPETVLLFPKGRQAEDELTLALKSWKVSLQETFPSQSDGEGRILRFRGLVAR